MAPNPPKQTKNRALSLTKFEPDNPEFCLTPSRFSANRGRFSKELNFLDQEDLAGNSDGLILAKEGLRNLLQVARDMVKKYHMEKDIPLASMRLSWQTTDAKIAGVACQKTSRERELERCVAFKFVYIF